jgi:hypothetical protein
MYIILNWLHVIELLFTYIVLWHIEMFMCYKHIWDIWTEAFETFINIYIITSIYITLLQPLPNINLNVMGCWRLISISELTSSLFVAHLVICGLQL